MPNPFDQNFQKNMQKNELDQRNLELTKSLEHQRFVHNEEVRQREKHFILELSENSIQKLTYFIIGIQVAICGYLLLQIDSLSQIPFVYVTFLFSALSICFGLSWRFLLNKIGSNLKTIDSFKSKISKIVVYCHYAFVSLTFLLMLNITIVGTIYLYEKVSKKQVVTQLPSKIEQKKGTNKNSEKMDDIKTIPQPKAGPQEKVRTVEGVSNQG